MFGIKIRILLLGGLFFVVNGVMGQEKKFDCTLRLAPQNVSAQIRGNFHCNYEGQSDNWYLKFEVNEAGEKVHNDYFDNFYGLFAFENVATYLPEGKKIERHIGFRVMGSSEHKGKTKLRIDGGSNPQNRCYIELPCVCWWCED